MPAGFELAETPPLAPSLQSYLWLSELIPPLFPGCRSAGDTGCRSRQA